MTSDELQTIEDRAYQQTLAFLRTELPPLDVSKFSLSEKAVRAMSFKSIGECRVQIRRFQRMLPEQAAAQEIAALARTIGHRRACAEMGVTP